MGIVLQFPIQQPTIIERLDASVSCMHRLQAASGLQSDEIRAEALGARLDMAGLRDAMHDVLCGAVATPGQFTKIESVWGELEGLFDQVASCASCSCEDSFRPQISCARRARLRATCQSALMELQRLRSLLVPMNYAEN
jgi:hypothetical protein